MTVFVALNGPPKCGKSTIQWELIRMFNEHCKCIGDSFAAPMKHFIAVALGEKYKDLPKDSPLDILAGYSPREFLIALSQEHLKPRYGIDFFGRLLAHRALRYSPPPDLVVVDDCGFIEELNAIPSHVLVHIIRPHTGFEGDSRSYLADPHYILHNDATLDELWIHTRTLVEEILRDVKLQGRQV